MENRCAASSAALSFSTWTASFGANGVASRFQATLRRCSTLLKPSEQRDSGLPAEDSRKSLPSRRSRSESRTTKLFVLDTNVLMHDPTSLFRFEEHDVFLPIFTLEELDHHKKGMTEVSRNARQASRFLDEMVSHMPDGIGEGIPLATGSG